MEIIGKYKEFNFNPFTGKKIISFEVEEINQEEINNIADKELKIEIKKKTKKRSLNANAYAWVLMGEIARKLQTTKENIYIQMLKRYSNKCCYIIIKENALETFANEWRTFIDLGEVYIKGDKAHQLQCFYGSSSFDSSEMAAFIDGIVSECKEIGIETKTPNELKELKELWRLNYEQC